MTRGDLSASSPEPRNRAERRSAAKGGRRRKAVAVATGASMVATGLNVFTASPASAATLTVSSLDDHGAGSLRQAILDANTTLGVPDTIQITATGTLNLESSLPRIVDELTISGPGHDNLTINGGNAYRMFYATSYDSPYDAHDGTGVAGSASLTISGVTLAQAYGSSGSAVRAKREDLTLDDVWLLGNHATSGGAIHAEGNDRAQTVTIRNSKISGNGAVNDGGAVFATGFSAGAPDDRLIIEDTDIVENTTDNGNGGAVFSQAVELHVSGSTFSDNKADEGGNNGRGGAIAAVGNSSVTITGASVITGNVSGRNGGAIWVDGDDLTDVLIEDGTEISGNTSGYVGGALYARGAASVTVSDSTWGTHDGSGNTALYGAAIVVDGTTGDVVISRSTIADAVSVEGGTGGIGVFDTGGAVRVLETTVSGNTTRDDVSGLSVYNTTALEIRQSTFSGNGGGAAIGVFNNLPYTASTVEISHSTIVGTIGGTGISIRTSDWDGFDEPAAVLDHTIVAGSTTGGSPQSDLTTDGAGALAASWSLVGDASGATVTNSAGSQLGSSAARIDPLLGALADNGGPTKTRVPSSSSPAKDAGNPAFTSSGTDQRGNGFARVSGSRVDIGAVEVPYVAPTTTTTAPPASSAPVPPTTTTTAPPSTPPSTPPTTTPPSNDAPPAPPSVPTGGSSSPVFIEDGAVKQVPLPRSAPPNEVTAALALSPTESIAVTADGRIFTTTPGDNHGGIPVGKKLNAPIVGLGIHWTLKPKAAAYAAAATEDEWEPSGYWLLASDGGVFSFGTATFHGSVGNRKLNAPIVGLTPTATGNGYYLVASDGGVFSFGDAKFLGSTGARKLVKPIVSMVPTPTGKGYLLIAADGGVFTFGDAVFFGSGARSGQTFVGAILTDTAKGYWLLTAGGKRVAFGDAD